MSGINQVLEKVILSFDISPTDFNIAKGHYLAVEKFLSAGDYQSGKVNIYLQGSFRLGTVIRPFRNSDNADYDIDQVCEFSSNGESAFTLKHDVGNHLKKNSIYRDKLEEEGKRCWTLKYASSDTGKGFHLDILPARHSSDKHSTVIDITHKDRDTGNYTWRSSNPAGYYHWFKNKNAFNVDLLESQKNSIFLSNQEVYGSIEDVPKQMIRTPLQRSIQLMKRHRDVYFNGRKTSPISIILTTICAHQYKHGGILETVKTFIDYVKKRLSEFISEGFLPVDNVLDHNGQSWIIRNPQDELENFADKWEGDRELARSFFAWVYELDRDIKAFRESARVSDLDLFTPIEQSQEPTYASILYKKNTESQATTEDLLNLIHQGIDKKISWKKVQNVLDRVTEDEYYDSPNDVHLINQYQIKIHSGLNLSNSDRVHIKEILSNNDSNEGFMLCCNLLLGTATESMLRACIKSGLYANVLDWPIIRLPNTGLPETLEIPTLPHG